MATITDAFSATVEDTLEPSFYQVSTSQEGGSPVFAMMYRSNSNVTRGRAIGKDWAVTRVWPRGVAGSGKLRAVAGSNTLSGPGNYVTYDNPNAFSSIDEMSAVAFRTTSTTLIEHMVSFCIHTHLLRRDQQAAAIGSIMAETIKGVARLMSQQESAVFFSTDTTNFALADLGDTSANVSNKTAPSADTSVMRFDLSGTNASGRIHRFQPGMRVDLFNSAGTTQRNAGFYLSVDNIDCINSIMDVRRLDGNTFQTTTSLNGGVTYATAGGDDDIIVIADSIGVAPNSLESWVVDGTTLTDFFDIDVRNDGAFQSYRPSSIDAPLTEGTLNRHVGWLLECFPGCNPTTALTTNGVLVGFIDNLDSYNPAISDQPGKYRYERNGEALTVKAGWESFNYRFGSRTINFYTDNQIDRGSLYVGSWGKGGITRYVPPNIPGTGRESRIHKEIEWFAPLVYGGGNIFMPSRTGSSAVTTFMEAHGFRWWNWLPNKPNCMKMSGLTEVLGP